MNELITVNRNLTGFHFDVLNGVEIKTAGVTFQIEDRCTGAFQPVMGEDASFMRAGDDFHCAVFLVDIIESEPDRQRCGGIEGPVVGVLVPGNGFERAGFFDEKIGGPEIKIRTEQAFNIIEDFVVHADVEEKATGFMPFPYLFGGFTFFEQFEFFGQSLVLDG